MGISRCHSPRRPTINVKALKRRQWHQTMWPGLIISSWSMDKIHRLQVSYWKLEMAKLHVDHITIELPYHRRTIVHYTSELIDIIFPEVAVAKLDKWTCKLSSQNNSQGHKWWQSQSDIRYSHKIEATSLTAAENPTEFLITGLNQPVCHLASFVLQHVYQAFCCATSMLKRSVNERDRGRVAHVQIIIICLEWVNLGTSNVMCTLIVTILAHPR